jgi:hypothetical protein
MINAPDSYEQLSLFPCRPLFDDDVWVRAKDLLTNYGGGAAPFVKIRLSDDILSDDDREFLIEIRRAIKVMTAWGHPVVH